MAVSPILAAYVYTGWHACPERDRQFAPGWTEWEVVLKAKPHFPGHHQPREPLAGPYDDADPLAVEPRIKQARDQGVDVFVHGWFWCQGKRVFGDALDRGFLGCPTGSQAPFAIMWANRMPHRVLPLKCQAEEGIDPARLVYTSPADFTALVAELQDRYFWRDNYWRLDGRPYLSIFDTTLFLRQLGRDGAARAVAQARREVGDFHLAAIDPQPEWWGELAAIGFDSLTHYVFLPIWKGGAAVQDYGELARGRERDWEDWAAGCELPYYPSVSPGWDATPRGVMYDQVAPTKYPWTPVVTGESPEKFAAHLKEAVRFVRERYTGSAPVFIASLNEWSEGHYLEPDKRWGTAFFRALEKGRPR